MTDLSQQLTALGYEGLFLQPGNAALDRLWAEPGMADQLAQLAVTAEAPLDARFLAAEILFERQPDYPPEGANVALALVYAHALQTTDMGNLWGLPGEISPFAGQHLVALGKPIIAELMPLLEDARPVFYEGSEEATLGNRYQYRVKDFAAFFLSHLCGVAYPVHQDPGQRDRKIAALRPRLADCL